MGRRGGGVTQGGAAQGQKGGANRRDSKGFSDWAGTLSARTPVTASIAVAWYFRMVRLAARVPPIAFTRVR